MTHPLLIEHRKRLEEQYETLIPPIDYDTFDPEKWDDDCKYDDFNGWYIGLLCTVINDKRIGRFVKELRVFWDLAGNEGGWNPNQTFPGALPGFTKARRQPGGRNARTFRQISEQALRQSNLFSQNEKDHWLRRLQTGNQMPAIALLLEKLLALKEISIKVECNEDWAGYDQLLNCVERAAAEFQSRSPLESPLLLPCQNLTTVKLEFDDCELHPSTDIKPFLALPSISFLRCSGLLMQESEDQPEFGSVPHRSSIVELGFINSSIDLTVLSELSPNSRNLKRFTYIYGEHEDKHEKDEWLARSPPHMIPVMGSSVGHGLEKLKIIDFSRVRGLGPETFKDFKSLKELVIEPVVLPDEEDGDRLSGIAGILPACLQQLDIYWGSNPLTKDVRALREYLVTFMQEANHVLPVLRKILITGAFSKEDEDTLLLENEVSGWRLSEVERKDPKHYDERFAIFHFRRTHEEAENLVWTSQTRQTSLSPLSPNSGTFPLISPLSNFRSRGSGTKVIAYAKIREIQLRCGPWLPQWASKNPKKVTENI